MDGQPDFMARQYAFAAHIRDPAGHPPPADVPQRRMAIYRDLFYRNVESFIAGGFPVLRSLYDDAPWHAMVRDFFARHRCATPLFLEIAQEFLDYLGRTRGVHADDPPFLLELAHYEWVELAVSIAEATHDAAAVDPNGDLLTGVPVRSPLAVPLSYRFPVHQIGPNFRPDTPGEAPTHLVVYRNRQDDVEFLEVNAVTQRLLALLQAHPDGTGLSAIERIAAELAAPDPQVVIDAGRRMLDDLHQHNILVGTRRPPSP